MGPYFRRPLGACVLGGALSLTVLQPVAVAGERMTEADLLAWAAAAPGSGGEPEQVSVAVRLNGVARDEAVVLRDAAGGWCFSAVDLTRWGLRQSQGMLRQSHQGREFYCLAGLPGYRAQLDENTLTLDLSLSASNFEGAGGLSAYQEPNLVLPQVGFGGFLNYDFLASRTDFANGGSGEWLLGMLGEAVAYTPWGSFENSFVGSNLTNADSAAFGQDSEWARLETFWRMDMPERIATLTIGDTLGASGYWGRPSRFAGVRYATNFETRPGYVIRPQLAFRGEAAVPSVVDVFVNDSRVQSVSVPGGPFEIADLPTFGNVGEAQIVVTDLLGRQTVTTLPFLTSQRQLRAGVSSFSFEAGVARETIGLAGNDYGDAQAVAQYRHGYSERLTAEGRAEWSEDLRAAGVGASLSVGSWGILSPVIAFSDSDAGSGALASLALERPSVSGIYTAAMLQWSDEEFRQLGLSRNQTPTRLQFVANAGQRLDNGWNVSLGYIRQEFYDRPELSVISAGIGTLWRGWSLGATLASRDAVEDSLALNFSVSRSFDNAVRGSSSLRLLDSDTRESADLRLQMQKTLPQGPGYGWRVITGASHRSQEAVGAIPAASDTQERLELSAGLRNRYATFTAEAGRANDIDALRLGMIGALGMVEGVPFVSRDIDRSFAMVQEPALAGLPVSVNGQPTAVLDEKGYALLPRLSPFAPNQIRVDADQAPLDLHLAQSKVEVVTGSRTGHRVRFDARRLRAANIRLLRPDGRPVPLGADVEVLGFEQRFVVAENGETYIAIPSPRASLRIRWNGSVCGVDVELPSSADRPAELGDLTCGMQP